MRACVQRVRYAKVTRQKTQEITGQIDRGFLILLGVGHRDTEQEAVKLLNKIVGLRIFDDDQGKMNLALDQIESAKILVVSQFTLFADVRKGRRPSFTEAAAPEKARKLYEFFIQEGRRIGLSVEEGVFQEEMSVELLNDGPVTLWIDTDFLS